MSKYVKNLIMRDIAARLSEAEGVAVINPRGIDATTNNGIRRRLRAKGVRMAVVKNALAKRALSGGRLAGFEPLLEGPSALVYGKTSIATVARLLLDEKKANDKLELRGIFFDGELYLGEAGVKQASQLPTREEAIAGILAALAAPGRNLANLLRSPGGKIASLLKAVEEKCPKEEAAAAEAGAPAGAA
jgi:large subunit ribosomal protein L10